MESTLGGVVSVPPVGGVHPTATIPMTAHATASPRDLIPILLPPPAYLAKTVPHRASVCFVGVRARRPRLCPNPTALVLWRATGHERPDPRHRTGGAPV